MKVYKSQSCSQGISVCRIDFCCRDMAEDILLRRIHTYRWTDHPLPFVVPSNDEGDDYRIKHCGHCGAKIDGEVFGEDFYTGPEK